MHSGQVYEKKTKKKATDAGEEHARYINLISTLGPEVSQEKYNHAVNVNQKHGMTVYNVAASLSRLADTEWQRSCECVRRFSPVVGPLGQWRALCEGGWTGNIPSDLPDPANSTNDKANASADGNDLTNLKAIEEEKVELRPPAAPGINSRQSSEQLRVPPPGYTTGPPSASESSGDLTKDPSSTRNSPVIQRQAHQESSSPNEPSSIALSSDVLHPPRAPFVDAITGSVRSLSAFPTPPTHFPLPPPRQNPSQQSLQLSASSKLEFPSHNQLSESPISANGDLPAVSDNEEPRTRDRLTSRGPLSQVEGSLGTPPASFENRNWRTVSEEQVPREKYRVEDSDIRRPMPMRAQTSLPAESTYQSSRDLPVRNRGDTRHAPSSSLELKNLNNRPHNRNLEGDEINANEDLPLKSRAPDTSSKYPRHIERMDTGASSGSIVAAMRDRYSNTAGSTSPPPRDLPRLPLSVNDLASRYKSSEAPLSPGPRTSSPPVSRQQSLPLLDTAMRHTKEPYQEPSPIQQEDIGQRRQQQHQQQSQQAQPRYDVVANLERKAKEHELKERELELERRALELEREKAKLQTLREEDHNIRLDQNIYREGSNTPTSQANQFGLRPRERRTSLRHQLQRPPSQIDLNEDTRNLPLGSSSANPKRLSQGQYPVSRTGYQGQPSSAAQPPYTPRQSTDMTREPQGRSGNNSDYSGSNSNTNSSSNSTHAPYCGCESCSVNKYKESGKVASNKTGQSKQSEQRSPSKPSGSWIRRLSMPVGNAFSSSNDSKRHQSNNSVGGGTTQYGPGAGIGNIPVSPGRGLFSLDYKKNASTTALLSSSTNSAERSLQAQEDGRLRNHGISNRSMTNLGILGRH
ncbi:hypothetical protein CPC08DRAFT_203174 [Agrocybe pediades]|nr:hypothetical protein CPC08DRAFT_203174 [Agrocybe pediades]